MSNMWGEQGSFYEDRLTLSVLDPDAKPGLKPGFFFGIFVKNISAYFKIMTKVIAKIIELIYAYSYKIVIAEGATLACP